MEISPKLFDECTNKYKQSRQLERKKLKDREEAWVRLEECAARNKDKTVSSITVAPGFLIAHVVKAEVEEAGEDEDDLLEEDEEGEDDLLVDELKQFEEKTAPQGGRFRRKSVLPVDESVLSEMNKHKSLEVGVFEG
jgi:serine/threonine-protein phosphatase 2A regulatory subunit B'